MGNKYDVAEWLTLKEALDFYAEGICLVISDGKYVQMIREQ